MTLGGGHLVRHTAPVTQKPTPETYSFMLTSVAPMKFNLKKKRH